MSCPSCIEEFIRKPVEKADPSPLFANNATGLGMRIKGLRPEGLIYNR
jgi:hypothetical protein